MKVIDGIIDSVKALLMIPQYHLYNLHECFKSLNHNIFVAAILKLVTDSPIHYDIKDIKIWLCSLKFLHGFTIFCVQ